MSKDNESSQVHVPGHLLMMVMESANAIIFIFLATYNFFQASEDALKEGWLQDSYHINCYIHTM